MSSGRWAATGAIKRLRPTIACGLRQSTYNAAIDVALMFLILVVVLGIFWVRAAGKRLLRVTLSGARFNASRRRTAATHPGRDAAPAIFAHVSHHEMSGPAVARRHMGGSRKLPRRQFSAIMAAALPRCRHVVDRDGANLRQIV